MSAHTGTPWRTLGATLFATGLIVGAYAIARDTGSPAHVEASAESDLLEKLAARDADNDGLRDWEEALYATNPQVADTRKLGMTDGEAVSKGLIVPIAPTLSGAASSTPSTFDPSIPVPAEGTVTRALSESFMINYAAAIQRSPNGELSPEEIRKLSDQILDQLNEAILPAPEFRTRETIKIAGSGPEAFRSYAAAVEAIFRANKTTASKTDITYLKLALEDGDTAALKHITSISKMYGDTAAGLAALSVPTELADDHLLLLNAMARLSKVTADFTRTDSDPFATLLALKQYPEAMKNMGTAFIRIHTAYRVAGVVLTEGEPGAAYVNLVESVMQKQKARGLPTTP